MFSDFAKFTKELYGTDDFIPLHAPMFEGKEKQYVLETIDSTFVSSNFIHEPDNCTSNYWLNGLIPDSESEKEQALEYFNQHQIMARPLWKPMHLLSVFKDSVCTPMNNTEWLYQRIINIPSSFRLETK